MTTLLTGIFTLLGVLLGFYLAKTKDIDIKKVFSKTIGPLVVLTDEVKLEKDNYKEEEEVSLKDYVNEYK